MIRRYIIGKSKDIFHKIVFAFLTYENMSWQKSYSRLTKQMMLLEVEKYAQVTYFLKIFDVLHHLFGIGDY